jgi:mannitol-specific phosphotransferase system IIBC component
MLDNEVDKEVAMPSTNSGKWAGLLLGLFVVLLGLFLALVASGQRGGDTLFTNLALTIPGIGAALSAIAGGVLGVYALTRRDRSILVILAVLVGAAVLFWTTAEILFPH